MVLVEIERDGPMLRLTLCRAEKRNALSHSLVDALEHALAAHAGDATIGLVVLTGAGEKAFASGGDLAELSTVRSVDQAEAMALRFRSVLDAVRRFPAPVVAALNGDAFGGGAELAMACDMRIAAHHARFGFLQSRLAITSAWGGAADLLDAVGSSRALRLLGSGEILSARVACDLGIIEQVVDDGEPFDRFVDGFVARFSERAPAVLRAFKAMAAAKRFGATRDELVALETAHFARTWTHEDHWAAVAASAGRAGKA